jgi:hypothetical protein
VSEPIFPAVYTVDEVAIILRSTEWKIYDMIKEDGIPGVIRLGPGRSGIRVVKEIFNTTMLGGGVRPA